ncbi:hypothetical protein [Rhodopirellula sp. MGV]|uniref:hypothetical protein n=1 Tax=Rhodopirellula sp. MGV TaxID=2023130 RepID=UPI000B966A57|nr:hypothetical protein [Rhodopirellula sp. MGV]OYP38900.1 hypothetical protein CGZ80_01385 [Rhodopirellula sp. MGV]PNY38286.1 hypothetical protein C2E31_02950 [Rhodopirellula baltica]
MRSGDTCPDCGDILRVDNTRTTGSHKTQYLKCKAIACSFTAKDSFLVDAHGHRINEIDELTAAVTRLSSENQALFDRLERAELLLGQVVKAMRNRV